VRARKPVWSEGLFITQHHLQQQDGYHESLVEGALRALTPFHFGIAELEIDERALTNGQVVVSRLSAILPDTTQVVVGSESDIELPAREVGSAFAANRSNLPVFVGLRHVSESSANVDENTDGPRSLRYEKRVRRVLDQNTGNQEQELPWARPTLRVLFGDESRDGYSAIQIAELIRSHSGQIMLRDTYIPPVMQVAASSFLHAGLRRVLTALIARQRALSTSRRQRSAAQIDFQSSDAQKFWLLDVLNGAIPIFSHMVDQGHVHPERAYEALAGLVGRLCTFTVDADPAELPKFDYLALGDSFEPLFARAVSLLDAVIKERYAEIPLRRREDGMYLGRVDDSTVLRHEFFLGVSSILPESELRDRLPKLSKIASWGQVGAILNSAVNGARIELEYRPPGALPVKPGVFFFKVHKTPEFWTDIQGTGTFAIYHPLPADSVDVKLYAVDPQNL
jgi:type VI secretion system protein ImpJ